VPSEFLFSHGEIDIHKTTVGDNPVVVAMRGGKILGTCSPARNGHDAVIGIPKHTPSALAQSVRQALEAGVVFVRF